MAVGPDSKHMPAMWESNQYSFELHLHRRALRHQWRVENISDADVILVAANFSLMCAAKMMYTSRYQVRINGMRTQSHPLSTSPALRSHRDAVPCVSHSGAR